MLNLDELITEDSRPQFEFQFDGTTYQCADPNQLDVRDLKALIEGAQTDPSLQLVWMLGDKQWDDMEQSEATFTMRHLTVVTEAWLKHYGMDVPKSGGSAKPSKRVIR